jgi:hypothetical protein
MLNVSSENKQLAKRIATAFGGLPKVGRFWDDGHKSNVDILSCADRPEKGVVSYSTIGLSDWPLYDAGEEYGVRVEFVGACGSSFAQFENMLATAAFYVINSKKFCYPGAIFENIIPMYRASSPMKHFLFVPPFLWEGKLETLKLNAKQVAWLLVVPISDSEKEYAETSGPDALERLFEEKQIDIFDLDRASVL